MKINKWFNRFGTRYNQSLLKTYIVKYSVYHNIIWKSGWVTVFLKCSTQSVSQGSKNSHTCGSGFKYLQNSRMSRWLIVKMKFRQHFHIWTRVRTEFCLDSYVKTEFWLIWKCHRQSSLSLLGKPDYWGEIWKQHLKFLEVQKILWIRSSRLFQLMK